VRIRKSCGQRVKFIFSGNRLPEKKGEKGGKEKEFEMLRDWGEKDKHQQSEFKVFQTRFREGKTPEAERGKKGNHKASNRRRRPAIVLTLLLLSVSSWMKTTKGTTRKSRNEKLRRIEKQGKTSVVRKHVAGEREVKSFPQKDIHTSRTKWDGRPRGSWRT